MWGTGKVGIKCEGEFLGWVYVFVQFHWTIPPDLDVRVCTFWCRYFSALFFFHLERAGSDFTGSDTTEFPRPQLVGSVSGFHRVNSTFPDFSYVFSWMRSGQLMLGFTGSKLYWVSRLSLSAVCVSWFGGSQSAFRECVLLEGLFSPAHPAVPLEVSRDTFFYLRLFFPVFFLFFSTTTATAAVHFRPISCSCQLLSHDKIRPFLPVFILNESLSNRISPEPSPRKERTKHSLLGSWKMKPDRAGSDRILIERTALCPPCIVSPTESSFFYDKQCDSHAPHIHVMEHFNGPNSFLARFRWNPLKPNESHENSVNHTLDRAICFF